MVKRDLNVVWSCDTRADYLDEELLYAMRRAGCQRISLGVESGAPEILNAVKKKISPEKILEVTRCAQRLGFQVRYYMMVGNRGETRETFKQSLDFLQQAKPHEYSFSLLTVYPGTEEFEILCQQSADITADIYFDSKMIELERFAGDASSSQTILQATLGAVNRQKIRNFNVAECQKILDAMPDLHLSHLETALAYYQEGEMETAKAHLNRALELGYPFPEVVFNYLACIAATHGDITSAEINLKKALQISPNKLSQDNLSALRQWQEQGAAFKNGIPPLRASHDFPVISYRPAVQPLKPGPITVSSLEGTASFTIGPQT
jgi:tetratricopeptide (TPR) repeat protein